MNNIVDKGVTRVDACAKVVGEAKYTSNLEPRDYLCARVVRSIIAGGPAKRSDLEDVLKASSVMKIVTCFDVSDYQSPIVGHPWSMEAAHQDIGDRRLLNRRIGLYGDGIAAVVASGDVAYQQTTRLIKVEYGEYKPMVTVEQAMAEGATPPHSDLGKDNVTIRSRLAIGPGDFTFEEGLRETGERHGKESLVVLGREYHIPRISHCHIELPVPRAYQESEGRITVTSPTQTSYIVRCAISQVLGLPVGRMRVIKPYISGGFGNKQDVLYEPLNAYLTTVMEGRPVRLEISRGETIYGTRTHHAIDGRCRALATKDGEILARKLEAYANNGGYASYDHAIYANYGNVFKDIYQDRLGTEIDCYTVWTSTAAAGAMRGYGISQTAFLSECFTDDVCQTTGAGPLTFRMENCMGEGLVDPTNGVTFHPYGLKKCVEEGVKYIGWEEKRRAYANRTNPIRRGMRMAISCYKTGVHPISLEAASARMILNQDGSMQFQLRAVEIGQGVDTAFSQMAAEITGISLGRVYIVSTQDIDTVPFDVGAYASRQTYTTGMTVKKYAQRLKARILDYVRFMLGGCSAEGMDVTRGHIVEKATGKELLDMETLALTVFYSLERSEHITVEVTSQCRDSSLSSGCCFVEVEVDTPLGQVAVRDIINVHDSEMLINSELVEAQVHGDMSMGLGYGLSGELLYSDVGRSLNDNLPDYKIPTVVNTSDLCMKFIQLEGLTGPYGNKSLGEPPTISVTLASHNAVLYATGIAMDTIPMTSQRLIEAFRAKDLIQSCNG